MKHVSSKLEVIYTLFANLNISVIEISSCLKSFFTCSISFCISAHAVDDHDSNLDKIVHFYFFINLNGLCSTVGVVGFTLGSGYKALYSCSYMVLHLRQCS